MIASAGSSGAACSMADPGDAAGGLEARAVRGPRYTAPRSPPIQCTMTAPEAAHARDVSDVTAPRSWMRETAQFELAASMARVAAVSLALALLGGCGSHDSYDQSLGIADVTNEQLIVLRNTKPGPVYALAIKCSGSIEGEAALSLMLSNGEPYATKQLKGSTSVVLTGGDWYSDTAELLYRPIAVRSGSLLIEYEFSTIQ